MKRTRRARLRVKKDTLRTLTPDQAAEVRGGEATGNHPRRTHPNSPSDTRYCLAGDVE